MVHVCVMGGGQRARESFAQAPRPKRLMRLVCKGRLDSTNSLGWENRESWESGGVGRELGELGE